MGIPRVEGRAYWRGRAGSTCLRCRNGKEGAGEVELGRKRLKIRSTRRKGMQIRSCRSARGKIRARRSDINPQSCSMSGGVV